MALARLEGLLSRPLMSTLARDFTSVPGDVNFPRAAHDTQLASPKADDLREKEQPA